MKLNGRWFPQIVDWDSGHLYPIYLYTNWGVASEPVGGRSRATELPCLYIYIYITNMVIVKPPTSLYMSVGYIQIQSIIT